MRDEREPEFHLSATTTVNKLSDLHVSMTIQSVQSYAQDVSVLDANCPPVWSLSRWANSLSSISSSLFCPFRSPSFSHRKGPWASLAIWLKFDLKANG